MGPIIGNSTVVPHSIKRVRIVEAVIVIFGGISRHFLLYIASNVQEKEVQSMVG